MKTNNKGFTLVELLVCIVIFAVVLAAAFGFMLSAAKSYTRVNDRLEIQRQSQQAINLIEEYVIDSNVGMDVISRTYTGADGNEYKNDSLYILDFGSAASWSDSLEDPANPGVNAYTVHVFKLGDDKTLRYVEALATPVVDSITGLTSYKIAEPEGDEVTGNIISFSVDYAPDEESGEISKLTIHLSLEKRTATYGSDFVIALRNKPVEISVAPVNPQGAG